jgi:predicted acetyltransferase
MQLVEASGEYKDSFLAAAEEYRAEGGTSWRHQTYLEALEHPECFEEFVERVRSHSRGENLQQGYVPQSDYWLVDDGEFIGGVGIRHRLSEHLLAVGGHIGYDIRPSRRRQGYGTKILELALPKARQLGLARVLVTCDVTNLASRRIIEKNGGVLENQVPNPETGIDKLRFWIDLA